MLPVGDHCGGTQQLALDDLAVTADLRGVYLVSLSRRRAVEPVVLNAVNLVQHTHPLARFLLEAPHALRIPCAGFDWGPAASLLGRRSTVRGCTVRRPTPRLSLLSDSQSRMSQRGRGKIMKLSVRGLCRTVRAGTPSASHIAAATEKRAHPSPKRTGTAHRRSSSWRTITATVFATLITLVAGLVVTGPAHAAGNEYFLAAGQALFPNQRLVSTDGQYVLVMQTDGNLVIYAPGNRAVWASGTHAGGSGLEMQGDGNLVIYAPGHVPVWATGTSGHLRLEMQTDGNAVLYTDDGHVARWAAANITDRNNIGQVRYQGYVQMRDNGWPDSHWSPLDTLWTGESGWRWNATNPSSGAYGIPQSIHPADMATAGADWHENPATQIRWGLKYIRDRYSSPQAAFAVWNSRHPHWY